MKLIGAAARQHIHHSSATAAILGRIRVRQDPKLFKGIWRWHCGGAAQNPVVVVGPIEQKVIRLWP